MTTSDRELCLGVTGFCVLVDRNHVPPALSGFSVYYTLFCVKKESLFCKDLQNFLKNIKRLPWYPIDSLRCLALVLLRCLALVLE